MTTDAVELPLMHWFWLTALSGIVSNIGWELFNYFGHATLHSFASAWHEIKKLPAHVFSLHAPLRVVGVMLTALAVVSLAQATGGFAFAAVPMQLIEFYRTNVNALGDALFAAVINEQSRHLAYDTIVAAFGLVFVVWRTAAGWRNYGEFQSAHGGLSLGTYFGLQLLGGLAAVTSALVLLQRLQ
ncbi:MAG: hypothetical protein K8S25_11030 [Alphaproteobacteria bacterium]|nr:hypothetical protein [Alphaproteobacteria bacterium]